MVLKELEIRNFRSYYGDGNRFEFNPSGLTLIIGDNGDGKTTFFEALEWLFDTTGLREKDEIFNISEMRKSQMIVGDVDEVRVTIKFEHEGEKELTKAFSFRKTDANKVEIVTREFYGYRFNGVEREQIDGRQILNSCFDAEIRRYSMFKGETQLDIFHEDTEALKRLLKTFSDITRLDKFAELTLSLKEQASKAHSSELKKDKKTAQEAHILERELDKISSEISDTRRQIRDQEENSRIYKDKLDKMVDNREIKEKLDSINERMKDYEEKVRRMRGYINVDFNTSLLDNQWILCAYPKIFEEFKKKVSVFSKERRKLHDEYLLEKGKQQQLAALALPEGMTKLPWFVPNEEYLVEMIDDECCKVCGRPAPKGSEAYEFMVQKLQEALKNRQKQQKTEDEDIFKFNYIEELQHLSISYGGPKERSVANRTNTIQQELEFIAARSKEMEKWQKALDDAKDEKSRILSQLNGISEEDINRSAKDVRDFMNRHDAAQHRLGELRMILEGLRKQQEEKEDELSSLDTGNKEVTRLGRIHNIFDHIYKAFVSARETNRRNFISHLKTLSNKYLAELNGNDFHGIIEMLRSQETESIDVVLRSENGTLVTNPSESQKTTMYMAVLFAIAKVTAEKRETEYPLIFDAPTSSFGQMKETEFYEIINKIQKQCVIVTKDMLEFDATTQKSNIKSTAYSLSCPIYRIEKDREGFNENDLSTIRVRTTKIK